MDHICSLRGFDIDLMPKDQKFALVTGLVGKESVLYTNNNHAVLVQ